LAENWIPEIRNLLAQRRAKKPDTKAGQIWALWPEIKAALADGQSFRSVCEWLSEDAGITVSVSGLRSYVSRSRRKERVLRRAEAESAFLRAAKSGEPPASTAGAPANSSRSSTGDPPSKQHVETEQSADDPMAGAIRALDKARRLDIRDIHGDGDPTGKKLI